MKTGHGVYGRNFLHGASSSFSSNFIVQDIVCGIGFPAHVTLPRNFEHLVYSFVYLASIMAQAHHAAVAHVHEDPVDLPKSLDPFTVTIYNGFMPLATPQVDLPEVFAPMIKLVEDMPVTKENGTPGLLASYQLGPTIDLANALPDLTEEIDKLVAPDGKPDLVAVTAAFRDYAFLASAYLLEPCWERWNKDLQGYGLGRQTLPRQLAGPLVKTAKL